MLSALPARSSGLNAETPVVTGLGPPVPLGPSGCSALAAGGMKEHRHSLTESSKPGCHSGRVPQTPVTEDDPLVLNTGI